MTEDLDDLTLVYMYGFKNGEQSMKAEIERLQVTMDVLLVDRRATLSENHDLWREIERLREAHATLGDQTWGRER
jgi:hypothetical protein